MDQLKPFTRATQTTSFDDLMTQYARRQIDRRHFLRRAAGLGLGAGALAAALTVLPGGGRPAAVAASQGPFDPPPRWPPTLPWPPFGPGPCFPIKVPGETARDAGIAFYVGHQIPGSGDLEIVALDKRGKEVSRCEIGQDGDGTVQFRLADAKTEVTGALRGTATSADRLDVSGQIAGQSFTVSGRRDGSDVTRTGAETPLAKAPATLLAQWGRIGPSLVDLGATLALTAPPPGTSAGCLGCVVAGGGLSIWAPGCLLLGPAGVACAGGWFVAAGTFYDNCGGACVD